MTQTNQIVIFPAKKKMLGQIILCLAFVVLGIWLIANKGLVDHPFFTKYRLDLIIGGFTILIFGSFLSIWIYKLSDSKPGIIINENGIVDNSSFISIGAIPWSDIDSVKPCNSSGNMIAIILKDPNKYIGQQKSTIKKNLLKANFKKCGSPVIIQTLSLNTTVHTLKTKIDEHLLMFK